MSTPWGSTHAFGKRSLPLETLSWPPLGTQPGAGLYAIVSKPVLDICIHAYKLAEAVGGTYSKFVDLGIKTVYLRSRRRYLFLLQS
jgi:hypothetical protein